MTQKLSTQILKQKLEILAGAANYDVSWALWMSCASYETAMKVQLLEISV